jgi:NAD(P)-dependent dehydrogenase (short-subunit alcohol dehydrogenase family)
VTGGGTGLGLVTATALAANGAKVYISGRRLEPLEAAAEGFKSKFGQSSNGGTIVAIQADVSTKEGITSEYRVLHFWLVLMVLQNSDRLLKKRRSLSTS